MKLFNRKKTPPSDLKARQEFEMNRSDGDIKLRPVAFPSRSRDGDIVWMPAVYMVYGSSKSLIWKGEDQESAGEAHLVATRAVLGGFKNIFNGIAI